MKYIFLILLSFFSFKSFAADGSVDDLNYPIRFKSGTSFYRFPSVFVGATVNSAAEIKAVLGKCVMSQDGFWIIPKRVITERRGVHFTSDQYIGTNCETFNDDNKVGYSQYTENVPPRPEDKNYCDTVQYQIDYSAAEKTCIDSANSETQNVTFTGSCDRENQVLVTQCEVNDKPVTPPEPELCPDGSNPPCDDDTGGGGSGGGSDNIDLTGVIEAINNANKTITGAVNDGHPAVNDLLSIQTKALSTSVESNRLLGVGIAALDVSNDALSNIANLTQDLNNKTASEVSQSVESNRLLGQGVAALNVSNDALSNIADLAKNLNNTVTTKSDRIADEIIKNTDELKLQTAQQEQITENQLASNDLLTGINANTDKTNELLANIDNTISSSSSNSSNELSKMLGTLISENKNNNSTLINKLDELEQNSNKHDLTYDGLKDIADSSDKFVDANLDTYDTYVQTQIIDAVIHSPMKETLFNNVKLFLNDLIPISSTCQNLSFGDYFTVDCSKFQKFRDIFGFFIYVYTALTLIDILFTGIVPNPARKPY